jgi:hypothetical protein
MLSKQLMLARQSANVTRIQLNQNTLQPKNPNSSQNISVPSSFLQSNQQLQKKATFMPQSNPYSQANLMQTSSTQGSTGL